MTFAVLATILVAIAIFGIACISFGATVEKHYWSRTVASLQHELAHTRAGLAVALLTAERAAHPLFRVTPAPERERRVPHVPREVRYQVLLRDGDQCRYDSVVVNPRDRRSSYGRAFHKLDPTGPDSAENYVVTCRACNGRLADGRTVPPLTEAPVQPYFHHDTAAELQRAGLLPADATAEQ